MRRRINHLRCFSEDVRAVGRRGGRREDRQAHLGPARQPTEDNLDCWQHCVYSGNLKTAPTAQHFGFEKKGLCKIPVTITDIRVSTENEYSVQDNINQLGPVHPENWVDELKVLGTDEDGPDTTTTRPGWQRVVEIASNARSYLSRSSNDPPVVFKTHVAKGE